jgi:soluble lytic murein transglycosylase-like protein
LHYIAPDFGHEKPGKPDKVYKWMTPGIQKIINDECKKQGMNPALVAAIIQNESGGDVICISKTGDYGIMQLNARHWLRSGEHKKDLLNPRLNIHRGVAWLKICNRLAKGNLATTLKNYNSGPNSKYYRWSYINRIIKLYKKTA